MTPEHDLIVRLRTRLAARRRGIARPPTTRTWADEESGMVAPPVPAAVLVPIVDAPGGPLLLLTRRAGDLRTHSGEISFPGGRVDLHETGRNAALREAHEELGINPATVEILDHLPRISTVVTGYTIAPWVGVVPRSELRPNPGEIAEVIEVPLEQLLQPGVRRDQRFIRKGRMATSPAYDIGPHIVWGATARILANLLDLLTDLPGDGEPHPVVDPLEGSARQP
jgi:8-oxo-dGTP pyrophosphatase MutT (NUDIX family)